MFLPRQPAKLTRGAHDKEHAMSRHAQAAVTVIGIDIGRNSFHIEGSQVMFVSGQLTPE